MRVFGYVALVALSLSAFAQQNPSTEKSMAVPSLADIHPVAACTGNRMSDIAPCMQGFVDQGSLIGLVTLVDRKGKVQLDAVGKYHRDSIFQIMSMTKPFVSVLILQLVEEGKIPSIDARVCDLPGFKDFPYRDVTIKELLTHTSGIWPKRVEEGHRLGVAPFLTNALDREPGITVRDKSLEFVASHYANPSLYPLQPKEPVYSNIGFMFLGRIAEKLSGMPLDQLMRTRIIEPLKMKDTFFFPSTASQEQRDRIADVDWRWPLPPGVGTYDKLRPGWKYVAPAGGLYSTAEDLRQFLRVFRHEGQIPGYPRILSTNSVRLLVTDQLGDRSFGCAGHLGRSLGFFVVRTAGCDQVSGSSPGTIMHNGAFATDFWYDPQKDEVAIFLYQVPTNKKAPWLKEEAAFRKLLANIDAAK